MVPFHNVETLSRNANAKKGSFVSGYESSFSQGRYTDRNREYRIQSDYRGSSLHWSVTVASAGWWNDQRLLYWVTFQCLLFSVESVYFKRGRLSFGVFTIYSWDLS